MKRSRFPGERDWALMHSDVPGTPSLEAIARSPALAENLSPKQRAVLLAEARMLGRWYKYVLTKGGRTKRRVKRKK